MTTISELPVSAIRPGSNDRKEFEPKALAELAASIGQVGHLIQPITVRPCPAALDGTEYEIVAGERRWRAHQLLGWPTVRAIVEPLEDEAASVVMLVENLQRTDLNPIEEAMAYRERIERYGQSIDDVARTAGVQPSRVKARMALLKLAPEVELLVRAGKLGPWFGNQLARLDHNRQIIALRAYQRSPNMAWDDFAAMCEQLACEQGQEGLFDADVLQIEEYLLARPKGRRKFTRRELIQALESLVAVVDDALGEEALGPDELVALLTARAALAGEEVARSA